MKSLSPLLLALSFVGCATSSNELSSDKLKEDERLYVGRILVDWNGSERPQCELYINGDITPSLRLSDGGDVFYRTDRASVRFAKIACLDKLDANRVAWHLQDLPVEAVKRPETNKVAFYFGEIAVQWKINRKATGEAADKITDPTERPKTGHVKESGILTLKFSSNFKLVEAAWPDVKNRLKLNNDIQLTEALVAARSL